LGLGNPELTFNPVYSARFTDNDRTAYISSVGDIIDLDVVLVTASGNIDVSPRFHPTSESDWDADRNDSPMRLVSGLRPTQHCSQIGSP